MTLPRTAKEAETMGLTRYFTGKPCSVGHICARNVSDWQCIECKKNRKIQSMIKNGGRPAYYPKFSGDQRMLNYERAKFAAAARLRELRG